ncbi:MAG TPA: HAMP domain-containing sensor histidine kinase [Candidatus Binatia bacterium]|nr:HAMP domain-containing sensor histidine kinase [Candidatus Binatia bacterium]
MGDPAMSNASESVSTSPDPTPERTLTDASLSVERAKADAALEQTDIVEQQADVIVSRARKVADEVLTIARDKADDTLARTHPRPESASVIDEERLHEDEVIEGERAVADAALCMERVATARALARILPLERHKTDGYLMTERARSDDALANRDDFLGMVTHDLRDLLSGIVLCADVISEQQGKDAPSSDTLAATQGIQRSAARMSRLIGDLVDIAGIDAGKLAITSMQGDACALVAEAVEIWKPTALRRGIQLDQAAATAAITATFDRGRVLQVLGNLITNAIKFSPHGSSVAIAVERIGNDSRFSVRDMGPGVPADKREAVFERFWQAGLKDGRGLGLGLYISRCLVEAHGGRIWVEGRPGSGSTFFFTIPC